MASRGPRLRAELAAALSDVPIVSEVRGHGFLLGVEYVDPRDKSSFLPPDLRVAGRVEQASFNNGVLIYSTQPTRDGFAGDQSLFAPPFVTTDEDLAEMVERFSTSVRLISAEVEQELGSVDRSFAGVPPQA